MSGNPNSIWKAHSDLFHRLYLQEDHPLKDVKLIAERDHNFPKTPLSTYEAKLRDELKLRKNLTPEEWGAIGRHLRSRPSQCSVFLCRVLIKEAKVKRQVRRYKKKATSDRVELPPDVSITPLSDMTKALTPKSESYPPISNSKPGKFSTEQVIRRPQNMPLTLATVTSSQPSANPVLDISRGFKPLPCRAVAKYTNVLVDQVFALLTSNHNSLRFVRFSAPILDRRFANQWTPLLDNLPIIQFQRGFWPFANDLSPSSIGHHIITVSDWGPDSLRSLEEIDIMDAVELGLLPYSHSQVNTDLFSLSPEIPPRFECRLSTFKNPFHALSIILHRLSNSLEYSFQLKNLMDEFCQQVPESMLEMMFMLDSPTIRAAWSGFLDWTILTNNQKLFQCLSRIILQSGIYPTHSIILSKLMVFSAWLGAADLCKCLISRGVPLDRRHEFRTMFKGSTVYKRYPPLAAAAVRGNMSIVELLLSSGARVNAGPEDNANGRWWALLSPVEYLPVEMQRDDRCRDNRLRILAMLLAAGADIYSPTRKEWGKNDLYNLTLLDAALLGGDKGITEVFLKYLPNGHTSTFSRSGVVLAAMQGLDVLSTYLSQTSPSFNEVQRRQIRNDALRWGIRNGEIDAVFNMIHAGFEPEGLVERYRGTDPDISSFIDQVFGHSPLTSTSRKLAIYIMENHQGKDVEYGLISAGLKNTRDEVWRFLVDYILQTNHIDKAVMISLAARVNNLGAIKLLRKALSNVTVDSEVWCTTRRYSVLLLSSGTFDDTVPALQILNRSRPASTDTLDFLVQNGADVASCHPRFWSEECWVEGTQVLWLLRNGLVDHSPTSVYSLLRPMMRNEGIHPPNKNIVQWLLDQSVPIFTLDEASFLKEDQNAETDQHPLSFFIATRCCPELIDRVLESGVSINTRGKDPKGFTPLEAAVDIEAVPIVEKLISLGVNIHRAGGIPLQLACSRRHPVGRQMAELLLKAGANPNRRGRICCPSPLQVVRDVEVMRLLLANGANPNEHVPRDIMSEDCRCKIFQDSWTVSLLRKKTCPTLFYFIDRRRPRGKTVDLVRTLLEGGAILTGEELLVACWWEDLDIVKLLLDWNANPNIVRPKQTHALSIAAYHGNLPLILLLLAAGAVVDPEVEDIAKSPLVAAAERGRLDVVSLFMQFETRSNVIQRAISGARSEEHFEVAFQLQQLLRKRGSEATGKAA